LQRERKVIISGGGTGGHIFPAVAIADALRRIEPGIKILFVGAQGKMEMEKVPAAGYTIEGLPVVGFDRSFSLRNLAFPVKVVRSLMKAREIIGRFKPDVAVGVGGYASGPLLFMASRKRVPTLIQEQNSYPGVTNKLLARKAARICVAYDGMERFFPKSKIILTGNPVREDMVNTKGKKPEAAKWFGLDPAAPVVLAVGGSQGARSINHAVKAGLSLFAGAGIQLIWQCGKAYHDEARRVVEQSGYPGIRVLDFISRMDFAYAMADVVLSRAGASTVSELCIVGKPSILVPLPTAAEDHQTHNCQALVDRNAAWLVKDARAMADLVPKAIELIRDKQTRETLGANIASLAMRDSAKLIANEVLKLIRN
jgi:UDP-N-acetylglucosamine--N-acetylmuramyl-(pentapeptide) pyrophosphoryl-undecaprenol N-acetylglucosamine transferase